LEKVVPRFISSVLLGENLTVHGIGEAARDFIHVSDCCRAIDLVIHAPLEIVVGQAYNVASSQHRSILSIAQDIVREMDYDADRITFMGDRPGQVVRHTGDVSKIKRGLGWTPQLTWEEGLQRTIEWYRDNREWWMKQLWMRQIPIYEPSGELSMF
jgi:dTDP-glucose 4,6-dehydratase